MSSTVAIVDDEEHLREAVAEYLEDRGLRVFPAADAAAMRALVDRERIDVAVLDIVMPGEDGLALGRWLRARGERPGIIFATSAGAPKDRVAGLELGADDYVVKPYDLRELHARIRGVLRRLPEGTAAPIAGHAAAQPPIRIGGFRFDLASHGLTDPAGQAVTLTAAEAALLAVLATRPNRILSRTQLLDLTGEEQGNGSARAIDVRVARLRAKLRGDAGEAIRTIRGEGYMFVPGPAA